MNRSFLSSLAGLAIAAPMLVSCGGGGDQAGARETAFRIVPDTVTITGGAGGCPSDGSTNNTLFAAEVKVLGGTAPYTISSSFPDIIVLSTNKVEHPGDTFQIGFVSGACMDPGTIAVVDSLNRVVTFKLITKAGS
jgi:hypothetical protein